MNKSFLDLGANSNRHDWEPAWHFGRQIGLSAMREDPRRVIGRTLSGDVLEIGPGHEPFPIAPDARVRYADRSVKGGRDKNWPELVGSPDGPEVDLNINLDVDGLAPIPDSSLDAVIACHVIEHLANPIAALREFERVLRRQGRLVLVVPDRNVTFDSVRQPTPLAHVLAKFHQGVTQVEDEDIIEFCSAIYYQPPFLPTAVREWYDPQRLDAELLELHRRRSIHVHCWSPEEFASLIAGLLAKGLLSWKFADLYLPGDPRPIEFGLVLERGASTGRAASNQFVRDWTSAVLGTPDHDHKRIAKFGCALRRDLTPNDRLDAAAALSDTAMPRFSKMDGLKLGQSIQEMVERAPETRSSFHTSAISNLRRLASAGHQKLRSLIVKSFSNRHR
jgi:SAM-dependent methyltransferase